MDFRIEPHDSHDFGPCSCCGGYSRTVSGFVYRDDSAEAAYLVHWTLGEIEKHGAHFDLIVGRWGEDTTSADRRAVSLEFRITDDGPAFMVISAANRPVAENDLVGTALERHEVIDTPLAELAFSLVDTIWLQDSRIAEIVNAV